MLQLQRRDRQDRDAGFVDEERRLVGAVRRSAVLHDTKPPRRVLLHDTMIEQDDAVADVFFQSVSRQSAVAALSGHDRRHALGAQPVEQPAQLGAQHARVGQSGKERLDRVEDDALGPDGIDRVAQADEQPFEVVRAGLLNLTRLDAHVVEHDLLACRERTRVEPERREIQREVLDALFE